MTTASEFAKEHRVSEEWIKMMGDREVAVLSPGQKGTYSGFEGAVVRHYYDGMYEVRLPGGITCIPGSEFLV